MSGIQRRESEPVKLNDSATDVVAELRRFTRPFAAPPNDRSNFRVGVGFVLKPQGRRPDEHVPALLDAPQDAQDDVRFGVNTRLAAVVKRALEGAHVEVELQENDSTAGNS